MFFPLQALKYDATSPLSVADSLKWSREEMFSESKGARRGASKLMLLITDGGTNLNDSAKIEAKMLMKTG